MQLSDLAVVVVVVVVVFVVGGGGGAGVGAARCTERPLTYSVARVSYLTWWSGPGFPIGSGPRCTHTHTHTHTHRPRHSGRGVVDSRNPGNPRSVSGGDRQLPLRHRFND